MAQSGPEIKTSRLSRRKKVIFSAATVLGFFLLLELGLVAAGVSPARQERDPFVGFEPGQPLFVREGGRYVTNPVKSTFFNKQTFSAENAGSTYRIFCMGGSTTYGHPFDHRAAFSAWLAAYLEEVAPDRNWEVINCGGISYASYRVALLMEELAEYQPDLFIIYTGHNEFLEDRTYGQIKRQHPALRRALSLVSHSRVFTVIESMVRPAPQAPESTLSAEVNTRLEVVGLDAYSRDEKWQADVLQHFRTSLHRMAAIARRADAQVIFVQPAANLKDFTPFKSEHGPLAREDLKEWQEHFEQGRDAQANGDAPRALRAFEQAEKLDPRHALGLWCTGDALLASGREDEAIDRFRRAADEDVCPLRALSATREILEDVATEEKVPLVDFPSLLEKRHGRPAAIGQECFCDHVHPRPEINGELAQALCRQMASMGIVPPFQDSAQVWDSVQRGVLGALSPYDFAMALHTLAMTLSWAGKDEEALGLAKAASEHLPSHPEVLSQYGRLLEKSGRDEEALQIYLQAVEANPTDSMAAARLGNFYGTRGDYENARTHLLNAVKNTPERAPLAFRVSIRLQLGDCLAALGDVKGAEAMYREAAALAPDDAGVRRRLAQ